MIRRKRFAKLPLQANYYPLPTATYIEDSDLRMTVLSKQPLGTASLSTGEIEVRPHILRQYIQTFIILFRKLTV